MNITPQGWMSILVGVFGFFFMTIILAPIAIGLGLLTWGDGNLGKIGVAIGVISLLLAKYIKKPPIFKDIQCMS